MATRTISDLCKDIAHSFETEYGSPMNGEGVGYIVAEWLEGFVATPGQFHLPDKVNKAILEIAHYAREEGRKS